MKTVTFKMGVNWWPYALEVYPSKNGLLLRPRRKARAGWARAFHQTRPPTDDLTSFRDLSNKFDLKEWKW
jgi:hypothetical protein